MKLLDDDYTLPSARATLKLKRNESTNPRAPFYKGFLAVDMQLCEALTAHVKSSDNGVLFADVALWASDSSTAYAFEGSLQVRSSENEVVVSEPPLVQQGEVSWY